MAIRSCDQGFIEGQAVKAGRQSKVTEIQAGQGAGAIILSRPSGTTITAIMEATGCSA
jgi:hypothetical protein